jgi:hypothetical protein
VWVPAKVTENDGGVVAYQTIYGEELTRPMEQLNPAAALERVSETSLTVPGISNLVNLDEFGEGAVIHQLRERYKMDLIYTTIGTILVSVNPYRLLPIYAAAQVDRYKHAANESVSALGALDPHVYSIAAEAYTKLYEDDDAPSVKHNQAVIISGESGAGTTHQHAPARRGEERVQARQCVCMACVLVLITFCTRHCVFRQSPSTRALRNRVGFSLHRQTSSSSLLCVSPVTVRPPL